MRWHNLLLLCSGEGSGVIFYLIYNGNLFIFRNFVFENTNLKSENTRNIIN